MNKLVRLLLIVGSSLLLVGVSYAYDCSSTAQYVDGSSYSTGAVVQNNGEAYQCTVGGWCTVGGPYAPGAGWAWTSAWSDLGVCAGGGNPPPSSGNPPPSSGNPPPSSGNPPPSSGNPPPSSGNPPPSSGNPPPSSGNPPPSSGGSCTAAAWDASTAYNGGAEVSYDGNLYSAKWWTQGDNPASHSGAWDVWNLEGACTGGGNPPPSSDNPPPSSGNPPPSSGNPPPSSGNPPPSSGNPPPSSGGNGVCADIPAWQAGVTYNKGDQVVYEGLIEESVYQSASEPNPSATYGPWKLVGGCHPRQAPTGTAKGLPASFAIGPYKDVGIDGDYQTGAMGTHINGSQQSVLDAIPASFGNSDVAITWSFATGSCGSENWAGIGGQTFAANNVQAFDDANINYIVGTGGAAGAFRCGSAQGLLSFIQRYYSPNMVGVDFDIEHTPANITGLINAVKAAQQQYPNMRFSFTLATFGSNIRVASNFNSDGQAVINAIQSQGLTGEYINLMTMDYGQNTLNVCVLGADGICDMGQSAIAAAVELHDMYGIPYDHIEITPMLGVNDTADEIFSLADADELADFAEQVGLGGIHWWSFDRDNSGSGNTGNGIPGATPFGFFNHFMADLNLGSGQ